jgi:hypothetical protein
MKKAIGTILIIIAITLGYLGVTKLNNSGGSVEIVGIELSASNKGKKTEAYTFLGLALLSVAAGVSLLNKKG